VAVYSEKHFIYIHVFTLAYSLLPYKVKASIKILCTPTSVNLYFNLGYSGEVRWNSYFW